MKSFARGALCAIWFAGAVFAGGNNPPQVLSEQKVYRNVGGLIGSTSPDPLDRFGSGLTSIGDLDGDGIVDLAVGGPFHDDGFPPGGGGVWILFMKADGTVRAHQAITEIFGGLGNILETGDNFGDAVEAIGDLDGDGVMDIAVGAPADDDGGTSAGSVWILFLNTNGTVKDSQKISGWAGGFAGDLSGGDFFGSSLAELGDLDGDGVTELAVGTAGSNVGALNTGVVWILHLLPDGTVKFEERIDSSTIGFSGVIDEGDFFGESVAGLGDLDGDTVPDLVVGAALDEVSGLGNGALYVLFLNPDGTVKGFQTISADIGGFVADAFPLGNFGSGVANIGDVDNDGVVDIAVGDHLNEEGANPFQSKGAIWILLMNSDGTVKGQQKIGAVQGNLNIALPDNSNFGRDITAIDDLDGDGKIDLIVGAPGDSSGGSLAGAIYTLFLGASASVETRNAGTNPNSLTANDPVIGTTWSPVVDLTTTGHSFVQILGYNGTLNIPLAGGQTLLMNIADPGGEQLGQPLIPGPNATFDIDIPNDNTLCGLCITVQGIHALGVAPFALSNAIDVVVGL